MFHIRRDHVEALIASDADFVSWYRDVFMPLHLPTYHFSSIARESRNEMILQGRTYARSFNLHSVASHTHFLTMMFKIGPNFFMFPEFSSALKMAAAAESQIIDRLYSVSPADAAAAIRGADDRYWWPHTVPPNKS